MVVAPLTHRSHGFDPPCRLECGHEYLPVCGWGSSAWNITFNNECEMKVYNCKHRAGK